MLANAAGDVVEIGGGTGANLSLYGNDVRSLTVTEPEAPMLRRLERRAAERAPQAMDAEAESIREAEAAAVASAD